ncbi:MAG: AAA family ATPase, partial [bacterium]
MFSGKAATLIASDISFEEVFEKHRGIYSALIGREQEMQQLQGYVTRMIQGRSSAVMISGEAGIGKSRLIWELGQLAKKQGVRYLMGRCVPSSGMPYQPIIESVRQYFAHKGIYDINALNQYINENAKHLKHRKDIVAMFVLRQSAKDLTIISKEQLWDTASEIIKAIAKDRPTVLHLDDLHWADVPSLDMLTYIMRTTTEDRVLIICTYRPEDVTEEKHPLRAMLKRKSKEVLFHEISLKRLDRRGTQNIISSVFENSAFTDRFTDLIHKETEGNPLFILEVLKLLKDQNIIARHNIGWRLSGDAIKIRLPKTVSEVISRRLEKLNREERELIDLAAVEGLSFQSDTLAHCLEQSRVKILRCLQNLESSHNLIHATKQGYQFDHSKIKDVVYDNLIPELRKEYHKIIGKYLEDKYGDQDEYAGEIASHLLPTGEEQKSIPFLIKAGEYSARFYVTSQAIQYFDRAIEIINRILEKSPHADLEEMKLHTHKKRYEVNIFLSNYEDALVDTKTVLA